MMTRVMFLSYLQNQIGYDKIKLYSFDVRSDSPSVRTLMNLNDVEKAPLIVINDISYDKYLSLEEISEILGIEQNEALEGQFSKS